MVENSSPNSPEEHAEDDDRQGKADSASAAKNDLQPIEAGEAPKADNAVAIEENRQDVTREQKQEGPPQPSKLKRLLEKLDLGPVTIILMFK